MIIVDSGNIYNIVKIIFKRFTIVINCGRKNRQSIIKIFDREDKDITKEVMNTEEINGDGELLFEIFEKLNTFDGVY